mmetsp:Transcript_13331/g.30405  ORF Transcript_13331/g.30405 Transcript_13331/m.30405 type:complete len:669 (+) Transcript_13331:86-2092(+)
MRSLDAGSTSSSSSSIPEASGQHASLDTASQPSRPPRPPRRPKGRAAAAHGNARPAVASSEWDEKNAQKAVQITSSNVHGNTDRMDGDTGLVEALSFVLCEILLFKYNLEADMHECAKRISAACTASCGLTQVVNGKDSHASVVSLLMDINSNSSLQLRGHGEAEYVLTVRLHWRDLQSFRSTEAEVSRTPGVARVVALVHSKGKAAGSGGLASWQALAVLRKDLCHTQTLVGRRLFSARAGSVLQSFAESRFKSALVFDLEVIKADSPEGLDMQLSVRQEYSRVSEAVLQGTSTDDMGPASTKPPRLEVSPYEDEVSMAWTQRLRLLLERKDGSSALKDDSPNAVLLRLQSLQQWMEGNSGDASMSLRSAFFEMGKHAGLVEAIRHYSAVAVGVGVELAIVSTGCRIIASSLRQSPDGAAAFAQSQAVVTLCGAMREWLMDSDVQEAAMLALRQLLQESPQCGLQALAEGAGGLVQSSLDAHPSLADLQRDGALVLRHLSLHQERISSDSKQTPSRSGIAAALLERRAGEAVKPGVMSYAVDWLFSGSRSKARKTTSNRSAGSAPPGSRAPPPAPVRPSPAGVPQLDFMGAKSSPVNAGGERAASVASVASGRRGSAGSGTRLMSTAISSAVRGTPRRADSPFTPSAVRMQDAQREQEGNGRHSTSI